MREERRERALSLAVLFGVNCLNFYDRQVLGALAEPVRREFALSDMQIGAFTTTFALLYSVAGLPLGRLADTRSRRGLLAAGVALWTALTAAGGLAASYWALLASRLGVAVGEAACAPAAASWIGDLFNPTRRSRAMAVFSLGIPVGGALSYGVSGAVAEAFGWRAALVVAALPAVVLLPALLALGEPRRGAADGPPVKNSPWLLLRIPAFRWIVLSGAVVNFMLYAFSAFLPAFLTRYHGLPVGRAGFWAGVGTGIAGAAGGLLAGVWGDRAIRRRKHGRMRAAALASLAAAPFAWAGIALPAGATAQAIPLIMIAYGLLSMYYGLVYAAIQDIVGPELRGTAMSVYFLGMYVCGAAFGPMATGRLSDLAARAAAGAGPLTEAARATGLHQAMYVVPSLAVVLAAVLWTGARRMRA